MDHGILTAFDDWLNQRGLSFEGVVIGATALIILGVISRETRDCDILDPKIPDNIRVEAEKFAKSFKRKSGSLRADWLNNGPESLKKHLPKGWLTRVVPCFNGKALVLTTLGRPDLLRTKLFAFCDRSRDREDCIALKPTAEELRECLEWVQQQDMNPDWPRHVQTQFARLAKELGYAI
jgi:hypothetical protein